MLRCLTVAVALAAGCSSPARGTPPAKAAPAEPPKLVVLLVIDQLPVWAFERDRALFTGGLGRLLKEGAYARAELPYAGTFTAPGHATIGTGAPPRVHGVIGNAWFRRDEGRDRAAEYDPDAPMFPVVEGARVTDTASSVALRVPGLADVLREATDGKARSIAVALKARAATLVTGKRPDLAVWFDADAGGMTTSRAYADEVPAWLPALARVRPPQRFVGQTWTPLDAARLAAHTQIADDAPGEGDVHGLGVAFPHPITALDAILHTPFGDEVVLDAAHAAIRQLRLGADDVPDLLAISLNAHDYAGHNWGPDSWEILDLTLRLDAALGELFATLDRTVGADRWALVMTSDHGATPLRERSPHPGARRVTIRELVDVADAAVAKSLGAGPWVAKVVSANLYMTDRWRALPVQDRLRTLDDAARALLTVDGIASVHPTAAFARGCGGLAALELAVCNSVAEGVSGELFLVARRGSTITDYTVGTHHDTPNDDNRWVPVIVRAAGVAPRIGGDVSTLQIAPTVSALLGVPAPPAATATPLFGLGARSPARP